MAKGCWGGRFPVVNFLVSQMIIAGLRWRYASRWIINLPKRRRFAESALIFSHEEARLKIESFLCKGFDKINIGGGPKNLEGFFNIDFVAHTNVDREIVANVLDLSFVPSNSISHIHSNHLLEHLTEEQISAQFLDYRRILKHGGMLTIRCPNALGACYGFWCEPVIETGKQDFIDLGFPAEESFENLVDKWMHKDFYGLLHWLYADVGNPENQHLTLITPTKLSKWLGAAGFRLLKMTEPEAVNIAVVAIKQGVNESDVLFPL